MQLTVNKQLKQEPNLWINKALTVLFIVGIMVWAGHTIEFNGVKEVLSHHRRVVIISLKTISLVKDILIILPYICLRYAKLNRFIQKYIEKFPF